jgi:hypothetical protein
VRNAFQYLIVTSLGVLIGAAAVWLYHGAKMRNHEVNACFARIVDSVTILHRLRSEEYSALTDEIEQLLSIELTTVSYLQKSGSLSAHQERILRLAGRYRLDHPFTTGEPNIDQEVNDLLQKFGADRTNVNK